MKDKSERYGTKEEWISYIKALAEKLGYTPTRYDVPQEAMAMIKKHYHAWVHIIDDAGLTRSDREEQQKLRQAAIDGRLRVFARTYGHRLYEGCCLDIFTKMPEYEFLKHEYMREEKIRPEGFEKINGNTETEVMLSYLRAIYDKVGYSPTMNMTEGAKTITRRFKTWFKALEEAHLPNTGEIEQIAKRNETYERQFQKLLYDTYKSINGGNKENEKQEQAV